MSKQLNIIDSAEKEFIGVYHSHWEAGGLSIEVDRRFFGLLPKCEYWSLRFKDGARLPEDLKTADIGSYRYRLRIRGQAGPKGCFGHLGMCDREVLVSQVLECMRLK